MVIYALFFAGSCIIGCFYFGITLRTTDDSRLGRGVTGVAVTIVVAFDIGVAVTPGAGATAICELFKTLLPNVSWMDLNSVSFKSIVSLLNLPQMGASLVFDLFKAISSTIHSSALYFLLRHELHHTNNGYGSFRYHIFRFRR